MRKIVKTSSLLQSVEEISYIYTVSLRWSSWICCSRRWFILSVEHEWRLSPIYICIRYFWIWTVPVLGPQKFGPLLTYLKIWTPYLKFLCAAVFISKNIFEVIRELLDSIIMLRWRHVLVSEYAHLPCNEFNVIINGLLVFLFTNFQLKVYVYM